MPIIPEFSSRPKTGDTKFTGQSAGRRSVLLRAAGLSAATALGSLLSACADDSADAPQTANDAAVPDATNDAASLPTVQTTEPPIINLVATQVSTQTDTPLSFTDAQGPLISVTDADGPGGDGTMDGFDIFVDVSNGTLNVADSSGAIVYDNGTGRIKVWATLAQLNAALATLEYVPTAGFSGDDLMSMTVYSSDRLTGTGQININVAAVADQIPSEPPAPVRAPDLPGSPIPVPPLIEAPELF